MTPEEYESILVELGWSKGYLAKLLGCHRNTTIVWSRNDYVIPAAISAWLIRHRNYCAENPAPSDWRTHSKYWGRGDKIGVPIGGHVRKRPSERRSPTGHTGSGLYAVFIYVFYSGSFAKVGISESPTKRIGVAQSGNPHSIEMLASYPLDQADAIEAETKLMLMLDADHHHGDWFKCTREKALAACSEVAAGFPASRKPIREQTSSLPDIAPVRPVSIRSPKMIDQIITPDGKFSCAEAARRYGFCVQGARYRAVRHIDGWRLGEKEPAIRAG